MSTYLTLSDLAPAGKRVLLRADLNVPLDEGRVADDFRIQASLPTINDLRDTGAVVVVCSHLGRPKGPDPKYRMDPVAERLGELGGFPVRKLDAVVGADVEAAVAAGSAGDVFVLENTRFEPGETKNEPELSDALARLADVFVLDAFGSAHRAHASTVGVAERLRSAAGPLLLAEVRALGRLLEDPDRPYTVILGGAKVSDKLGVMKALLPRVDRMLVGGGMCFTLLKAQGHEIGSSLLEEEMVDEVGALLASPEGNRIVLPVDVVAADGFKEDAPFRVVPADAIPAGTMGLDIGPAAIGHFEEAIAGSASIFWNGPMGVFEWEHFEDGTRAIAGAVTTSGAFTVTGGGDTVAALRAFGMEHDVSHLSTGGGAGLEMLEGKKLPGLAALERWGDGS